MTIYLHLLGAFACPELEAESPDAVGWIHTLGPLDAVATFQDGRVRLNFKKKKNPQREGLREGQWLKRIGNHYEFGGQLYATFIINHQRRYP